MKWIVVLFAGLMLACIARADDGFLDRVKQVEALAAKPKLDEAKPKADDVCPCRAGEGCGCASGECECSQCACIECSAQYYRFSDGFTYEFKRGVHTGVAWGPDGKKWVNGRMVTPPRVVSACAS